MSKLPTDLASPNLSPDECCLDENDGEFTIQSNRPRATATDYFARACRLRFQDVRCERRYLRLLTRQESYDASDPGGTSFWRWFDNHEPRLTLSWQNAPDAERICMLPNGAWIAPPKFDTTVPEDWRPNEPDPVWTWCDKKHPDAIACWFLEEKT